MSPLRAPGPQASFRRAILLLALLGAPGAVASAQGRLVLTGATLVDGTGAPPLPDARIVIAAGRFTCVSGPDGCPAGRADRVVDLSGRWVIPGLIDTHIHLPTTGGLDRVQQLRFALGITTTRDAGSVTPEPLVARRDSAELAALPVPRLVVAARTAQENAARYGVERGGPLVRALVERGVDAVKIKHPFTGSHWREEIVAARRAGVVVFGHTWGDPDVGPFGHEAIAAGINGISHLIGIPMESQPPDITRDDLRASELQGWEGLRALWSTIDTVALDRLIDRIVTAEVWLEPMLAHEYYWGRRIPPPEHFHFLQPPPRLRDLVFPWASRTQRLGPRYPDTWQHQAAFVRRFRARGGILVTGTDDVDPGLDIHEEMRLIREATGDPMAALLAATGHAARAVGRDDIGMIVPGRLADAVVLAADPLGPEGATAVLQVIKGGELHDDGSLVAAFLAERDAAARALWRHRAGRFGLPALLALGAAALAVALLRRRRHSA